MKDMDSSEVLKKVLDLLEQQMGPSCEVVFHDLERPYDSTIVDIRNGHITGRKAGSCGSNLGLEVMRGTVVNGDRFNYITHTASGRTLRSSSVFFYNEKGKACACLCVNQDITETLRLEGFLHEFNQHKIFNEPVQEVFAQNVGELLNFFIAEGQKYVGKTVEEMKRGDKIAFVHYLDQKGALQITRSSERICETLGISKYTLYQYLAAGRNGNGHGKDDQDGDAETCDETAPEGMDAKNGKP